MASTFILKRKTYSDEQKSGWGKKLAIGATVGTLGAAAGFMGAKTGMLGNRAQLWANRRVMDAGRMFGKDNSFGKKLVESGKQGTMDAIKGMRQSRAKEYLSKYNTSNQS